MNRLKAHQSEILDYLSCPDTYSDKSDAVSVKETHISWVFLTRRYAFKLKKPVAFPFLDFSSIAKRKQACHDELRLNRRLAPDVYLDVLPICESDTSGFEINGAGEPIDWLIKMRRLDERRTLESRIKLDQPSDSEIASLAQALSEFLTSQPPVLMKADQYVETLESHIDSNEADLLRMCNDDQEIMFLHAAQQRYLSAERSILEQRVCDGRMIDGHGDLRPEHIFLEPKPTIIDCVEFNAEYRCNDIADELAFLAMECERLGRADIGRVILNRYCDDSHDDIDASMFAFFKCYRACVRAKVARLRATQPNAKGTVNKQETGMEYLRLAKRYLHHFSPNVLITIGGKMGAGKSTLAETLADRFKATLLQSDVIRNEIFEDDEVTDFSAGKYSERSREQVYERMLKDAPTCFASNPTVILDATFSSERSRQRAHALAERLGVSSMHFECECSDSVALKRIAARSREGTSASEARVEHYQRFSSNYEPPDSVSIPINTELPLADQIAVIANWIVDTTHRIGVATCQ